MPDNREVISEDTFEMEDHIANSLINKLDKACGFFAIPRGERADIEEANKLFVEEIKNDPKLIPLNKAALISNSRKILQEYINQNDIVGLAVKYLQKDAYPDKVDDDWIRYFMDQGKNISNKDVQMIFGRLLAEECNVPGSISKFLIHIVSIMDSCSVDAFNRLCRYKARFSVDNKPDFFEIVIPSLMDEELKKYGINLKYNEFVELEKKGLINITEAAYGINEKQCNFQYGNKKYQLSAYKDRFDDKCMELQSGYTIPIGQITLSQAGGELVKTITNEPVKKYMNTIFEYWEQWGITVNEVK